jgi:predicted DNA-binding transcriptional regulator AlpA
MSKKKHTTKQRGSRRVGQKKDPRKFPIFEETRHFISIAEAARSFGVSRQTLYRWMEWETNPFPKPTKFNDNIVRMSVAAIRHWVESCEEATIMEAMLADAEDSPGAA